MVNDVSVPSRDVNKDSRLKDKDQGLEFKDRNQGLCRHLSCNKHEIILGDRSCEDSVHQRYSLLVLHMSALHNYNNVMLSGIAHGTTGRVTKHLIVVTKSLLQTNIVSFYEERLMKKQRNYTVAG